MLIPYHTTAHACAADFHAGSAFRSGEHDPGPGVGDNLCWSAGKHLAANIDETVNASTPPSALELLSEFASARLERACFNCH